MNRTWDEFPKGVMWWEAAVHSSDRSDLTDHFVTDSTIIKGKVTNHWPLIKRNKPSRVRSVFHSQREVNVEWSQSEVYLWTTIKTELQLCSDRMSVSLLNNAQSLRKKEKTMTCLNISEENQRTKVLRLNSIKM